MKTHENKKIRWLIAHEPKHLFIRTARAFAEEVEKSSQGRLSIELLTTEMLAEKYGTNIEESCLDVVKLLTKGEVEMTQTQVSIFGEWSKNFKALDLPFLFRDHDHVTKVLEGRIGQALCSSLTNSGDMRGLAFTYSGGFRVIGSNEPITNFADFKDLRVRVNTNPVNADVMSMIGAKPHAIPFKQSYGYDLIEEGQLDAAETTYLRFLGKYLVKTNHSMFMTVIAMNESFFQGLDSDLQEVVKTAAICASRLEREWSIQDAKKFEEDCAVNGVTITSLSDEDQAHFREQALKVYEKWEPYFMPGMIEHIRLQ